MRVTVRVAPPGALFVVTGDGGRDDLRFESPALTSTGQAQKIELVAKGPLPARLGWFSGTIAWTLFSGGTRQDIGSSGPYEILVLMNRPIETNSLGMTSRATYKRVSSLLTPAIAGNRSSSVEIAAALQRFLNDTTARGIRFGPSGIAMDQDQAPGCGR